MTVPTPAVPGTCPERPWLGLSHFTSSDHDYFFGREAEIQELGDRVRRASLTVLYGVSGYGKSSLLGAGLLPSLTAEGFTVTLMRRCYESLAGRSLVAEVIGAVAAGNPGAILDGEAQDLTLWEFFHDRRQPWLAGAPEDEGSSLRQVLVMDQFEEIFTRGEDRKSGQPEEDALARHHAHQFMRQFADLVENRPPEALRKKLESGTTSEKREILSRYAFQARPVRCLLSLRDDFLARLERWRRDMPGIMEHRVELRLLSGPQAFRAVFEPGCKRPGEAPLIPREAAEMIVRTVTRVDRDTPLAEIRAVPSLLSLLCEQLNENRLASGAGQVDADLVSARSEDILQNFYDESFSPFPGGVRESVRSTVEDRMVTDGGHRHPVAREAVEEHLLARQVPEPNRVIDALIHRRLLSAEDQKGVTLLEITHDVIVPLILRSRKERRKRIDDEARALERAEEARKARRRRRLVAAMSVLTLLAIGGAGLSWRFSREAYFQRDEALYQEGLAWLLRSEVADQQGRQFPGTLIYAAKAIGFDQAGRPDGAKALQRFIPKGKDGYNRALEIITKRPAYLPVWSSRPGPAPLTVLASSPTGRHLAAGTRDGNMTVWDFSTTGKPGEFKSGTESVTDIAFHPDGTRLFVAGTGATRAWDLESPGFSKESHDASTALAFSPGGRLLVLGDKQGDLHLLNGNSAPPLRGLGVAATRISFSLNNSIVAATCPSKGVLVAFPWSRALSNRWAGMAAQAAAPPDAELPAAISLALSPDGSHLVTGTTHGALQVWDVMSGNKLGEVPQNQRHTGPVHDLSIRTDGHQLASAGEDGLIKLWQLDDTGQAPELVATLTGHVGPVRRVRYLPGGDLLATCGDDGTAKLWDVSGQPAAGRNLFQYVGSGSYVPGLDLQPLRWNGKSEFMDLPANSLAGRWKQPGAIPAVFDHLMTGQEWQAAILTLPESTAAPADVAVSTLAAKLTGAAEHAAAEASWNLFDLHVEQAGRLDVPIGPRIAKLQELRSSFAASGKDFTNSKGMSLVWCPPGTFTMGSPEGESTPRHGGELQHPVTLTSGFWIGKFELTQAEWKSVTGENPARNVKLGLGAPIEQIDWNKAMDFCRKLTDIERSKGSLPPDWEYSLPTAAQWEYACRAGNSGAYCYGNDPGQLHLYGNFKDRTYSDVVQYKDPNNPADTSQNDGQEAPRGVGMYRPNAWGIHDMHGNILEWCLDSLNSKNLEKIVPDVPLRDPVGTEGNDRELRGGSWRELPAECRSARGQLRGVSASSFEIGMRIALVKVTSKP